MNAPGSEIPQDAAQRAADVLEFLGKAAGSLALLWAFIAKVGKPYIEWRGKRRALEIRSALKTELDCIGKMPEIERDLQLILERQNRVFDELDLIGGIATENHERLDEFRELMDAVGFASRDRRDAEDRRQHVTDALRELNDRRNARRRRTDLIEEEKR